MVRLIHETFPEDPHTALAIAKCESGLQQWYPNGRLVTGKVDPHDTGLMQINTRIHGETLTNMGLDVANSVEDNVTFARHLYDSRGGNYNDWVCYTKGMLAMN